MERDDGTVIPRERSGWSVLALLVPASFAALLAISFQRTALNYGNETDFLGGFVPEAVRFLNGDPLAVEYHPPLYSLALALAYRLTGDWLRAGLLLSLAAAFATVSACFRAFGLLYGRAAALGAVGGLALSYPFLSYSLQATSDVFFLALSCGALLFLASAQVEGHPRGWFWGGLLVGLAAITRAHGAVMVGFLAPALRATRRRSEALGLSIAGVALPLAAWAALAAWTGSPLLPQSNYENLALTYYGVGDRTSGDGIEQATAGASSTWDVLARNPRRVARVFLRDMSVNVQNLFLPDLMPFPLCLLAFPALCVLLAVHVERFGWAWPLTLGASFLVLNLKAWETRYYLMFVPFMGAGVGLSISYVASQAARAGRSRALAFALAVALVMAVLATGQGLRHEWSDLSRDAQGAARVLAAYRPPAGSAVVARKPHVCFYSGLECEGFPDVRRLEDLQAAVGPMLSKRPAGAALFLFYGWVERELRPDLAGLLGAETEVSWLRRIGEGRERRMRWVLFEVVREGLAVRPALPEEGR